MTTVKEATCLLSICQTDIRLLCDAVCSNLGVFGQELADDSELTGEELVECLVYKRRSWNGILPVNYLAQWASDRKVGNTMVLACVRQCSRLLESVRALSSAVWSSFGLPAKPASPLSIDWQLRGWIL